MNLLDQALITPGLFQVNHQPLVIMPQKNQQVFVLLEEPQRHLRLNDRSTKGSEKPV